MTNPARRKYAWFGRFPFNLNFPTSRMRNNCIMLMHYRRLQFAITFFLVNVSRLSVFSLRRLERRLGIFCSYVVAYTPSVFVNRFLLPSIFILICSILYFFIQRSFDTPVYINNIIFNIISKTNKKNYYFTLN